MQRHAGGAAAGRPCFATADCGFPRMSERAPGTNMKSMISTPLHVVPTRLGRWRILREDDERPLSVHENATDALRRAKADAHGDVILHDRYGRTHVARRRDA